MSYATVWAVNVPISVAIGLALFGAFLARQHDGRWLGAAFMCFGAAIVGPGAFVAYGLVGLGYLASSFFPADEEEDTEDAEPEEYDGSDGW